MNNKKANYEYTLNFDKKYHTYTIEKEGKSWIVPSVTSVLGAIDKSYVLVPWAVKTAIQYIESSILLEPDNGLIVIQEEDLKTLLKEAKYNYRKIKEDAAEVGTEVHNYIECYIKKQTLPKLSGDDRVQNCVTDFIEWVEKHKITFVESETRLYSQKYNFCGTMDWMAHIEPCGNKKCCDITKECLVLGDTKSSNAIYDTMGVQLAAYKVAYEELYSTPIDERCIIRVSKDGTGVEMRYFKDQAGDFKCFRGAYQVYEFLEKKKMEKKKNEST